MTTRDEAKILFDELTAPDRSSADRWARAEQLVAGQGEEETLHVEFKSIEPPWDDPSRVGITDDKLARTLSGFANQAGGVAIYGVSTKEGKKGEPDRAKKIVPVGKLARFTEYLQKRSSIVVEPAIGGIDIRAIENPSKPGEGLVAVLVPQSDGAPHRAAQISTLRGETQGHYYMRTTTDTIVIPHAQLAAMFARTAPPALQLRVRVGGVVPLHFNLSLFNSGRGAAMRPAIIVRSFRLEGAPLGVGIEWGTATFPFHCTTGFVIRSQPFGAADPNGALIEPTEDMVVYPGMERAVCAAWTKLHADGPRMTPLAIDLEVELYALHARPIDATGRIDWPAGATSMKIMTSEVVLGETE